MKFPLLCFCLILYKMWLPPAVSCWDFWHCSLQLAAPVHPVRIQGPVTQTICQGTNGHADHSHRHERPKQGRAISICEDYILVLRSSPCCAIHINAVPRMWLGFPFCILWTVQLQTKNGLSAALGYFLIDVSLASVCTSSSYFPFEEDGKKKKGKGDS